jgi:integrase
MRLGEAVGLSVDDIRLDDETPHVNITPHPWRRLKTKGREKMCSIGWRSPVGSF